MWVVTRGSVMICIALISFCLECSTSRLVVHCVLLTCLLIICCHGLALLSCMSPVHIFHSACYIHVNDQLQNDAQKPVNNKHMGCNLRKCYDVHSAHFFVWKHKQTSFSLCFANMFIGYLLLFKFHNVS